MSRDVYFLVEHFDGKLSDIAFELAGISAELAKAFGGDAVALLLGQGLGELGCTINADRVVYIEDAALESFNPEAYQRVLAAVLAAHEPRVVLIGSTPIGMDLAGWLAVALKRPLIAYAQDIACENDALVVNCQLYGGRIEVESVLNADSAIVLCLPGAFAHNAATRTPQVEQIQSPVTLDALRLRPLRMIRPESGDVVITSEKVLVSVGRGIGGPENLTVANELATVMGGALSASRPITDAGWLPKTRQVGISGQTVRPKVYLALGISGATEHVQGMRDSELIIAINTDPHAPIFQVAHYGATCDVLKLMPVLLEKVKAKQPGRR
jgi:electron transfer flavoprotein alpha subunit